LGVLYRFGGQEFGGRQPGKRKAEDVEAAGKAAEGAEETGNKPPPAAALEKKDDTEPPRLPYAKPITEAKGHTSYMTFARLAV
jgi:hypothetical protein